MTRRRSRPETTRSSAARSWLQFRVEKGTIPASSHGLPTSGMREATPLHAAQRIFTLSIHGRCGLWPSNCSHPETARSRNSSAAADHLEALAARAQTQMGRARPQ